MIITPMIPNMGFHFLNPDVKGFDVRRPAILVYLKRGTAWQLGALEWVFPEKRAKPPIEGAKYGSFGAACHYADGTFVYADAEADWPLSHTERGVAFEQDRSPLLVDVLQSHAQARRRKRAAGGLGPLDEADGIVEVRLECSPVRRRDALEAVEVEVRDGNASLVAVADGVRRARHRLRDAEGTAGAADERRLAGAELAGDGDDVAGLQVLGDAGGDRLGLLRAARRDLLHAAV